MRETPRNPKIVNGKARHETETKKYPFPFFDLVTLGIEKKSIIIVYRQRFGEEREGWMMMMIL